jgi:anti-sigma factor RsiW
MKECLEEGTIQAYVDGELSPEAAHKVAAHAAVCAACTAALGEAENELALLATALEPELNLAVPTERLRERLDAAIGELRPQERAIVPASGWSLKGWLSSLAGSLDFSPRHAAGFASLIAVVALTAIFAVVSL